LNQLSCVISKINRAWKLFFRESDGDIGYFSDILVDRNGSRSLLSLSATKVAFETLEALKEDLDRLDNSCGILAKTVSWNCFSNFVIPSLSGREVLLTCTART
jgi:hypothetical protein